MEINDLKLLIFGTGLLIIDGMCVVYILIYYGVV